MFFFEKNKKKPEGAVTYNRIQIAAASGLACFCRQREYLGSYRASTTKDACCAWGMNLSDIREGRFLLCKGNETIDRGRY